MSYCRCPEGDFQPCHSEKQRLLLQKGAAEEKYEKISNLYCDLADTCVRVMKDLSHHEGFEPSSLSPKQVEDCLRRVTKERDDALRLNGAIANALGCHPAYILETIEQIKEQRDSRDEDMQHELGSANRLNVELVALAKDAVFILHRGHQTDPIDGCQDHVCRQSLRLLAGKRCEHREVMHNTKTDKHLCANEGCNEEVEGRTCGLCGK